MAKKRKLSTLPTIRSKEMKELRETTEDLSQQPEGTANESGVDRPEKVSSAREHLKSVLQDLLVVSDDSSEEPVDDKEEREVKEKEEDQAKVKEIKKEKVDESRSCKKRRRRIKTKEAQFHHTYVMKLFDRSVDLAQFKEDTPLYPICRAWMENQPRNNNISGIRRRTTSIELNEEDEEDEREAEAGKVKNTYKLPPPIPMSTEPDERKKLRVPSPIPYERAKEIDMDLEVKPSRDLLLHAHVTRWTAIRKKWHRTGHKNEARFADSAVILKNIFKQSQSSFACST